MVLPSPTLRNFVCSNMNRSGRVIETAGPASVRMMLSSMMFMPPFRSSVGNSLKLSSVLWKITMGVSGVKSVRMAQPASAPSSESLPVMSERVMNSSHSLVPDPAASMPSFSPPTTMELLTSAMHSPI